MNENDIIIVSNSNDKPIKVCFELHTYNVDNYTKKIPEYENIKYTLGYMLFDKIITTDQFRSVKGQAKHGNLYDAIKFIERNGYLNFYMNLPKLESGVVFKIPFGMVSDNMRFGVFNIE